jgi:hypothetical protein
VQIGNRAKLGPSQAFLQIGPSKDAFFVSSLPRSTNCAPTLPQPLFLSWRCSHFRRKPHCRMPMPMSRAQAQARLRIFESAEAALPLIGVEAALPRSEILPLASRNCIASHLSRKRRTSEAALLLVSEAAFQLAPEGRISAEGPCGRTEQREPHFHVHSRFFSVGDALTSGGSHTLPNAHVQGPGASRTAHF